MNLYEMKDGQVATIKSINIDNQKIKRRVCDLGILRGENVLFLKSSILKKVVLFAVKNYSLCLKKEIAQGIEVEIN